MKGSIAKETTELSRGRESGWLPVPVHHPSLLPTKRRQPRRSITQRCSQSSSAKKYPKGRRHVRLAAARQNTLYSPPESTPVSGGSQLTDPSAQATNREGPRRPRGRGCGALLQVENLLSGMS